MSPRKFFLAACTCCLIFVSEASALPLWEITGTSNRIHLVGSIHFLRPQDYPLPDAILETFDNADVIVMELDLT
jgi:uncharacterized protein YbaP (TraB family)